MDRLTALLNASKAVRRLSALAMVLTLVMIGTGIVWLAANSLGAEAQTVKAKRQELGQLQSVIALKKALENRPAISDQAAESSEFLQGSSEAIIRGNLQSRFTAIAASHGVNVLSVGNAPILQRGDIRYAGLRADFSGTNEAVHGTLFEIETSRPFLVIRNVVIRSTISSQTSGQKLEPEIVVQVQFYGALPPAGPELAAASETGPAQ